MTWKCYCGKDNIPKGENCPNCERSQYKSIQQAKRYYKKDPPGDMYG